ncbi:MAG: hypothetical protein DSY46_01450 [Hydrogenimonas sp.]|nr:MAG: hypothetical protein DSY46_01450 [Hydrogenimonas sp.]
MTVDILQEFLGWCSVMTIGLLLFYSIFITLLGRKIAPIHAKLFHLGENDILRAYFQYVAKFKIFVIIFNLVPYFALVIIS